MRIQILLASSLLLVSSPLTYGKLADATNVLRQVASKEEVAEEADLVSESIERLKELSDPTARSKEWITLLSTITASSSDRNDYSHRERAQAQLKELGNYFPAKTEWPILKDQLKSAMTSDPTNKAFSDILFIIALLESDEVSALKLFEAQIPNSATTGNAVTKALELQSQYGSRDQHWQHLLRLALQESALPNLQKVAIEAWLASSNSNQNRYYGNLPDLSLFYTGEALEEKLSEMCKAMGDRLSPGRLSKSLRGPVYQILKTEGIKPSEDWIRYLDPQSASYQSDLDYFKSQNTDTRSQTALTRLQLQDLLKENRVDDAWELWQTMAETNAQDAGRFILSLFGWEIRNYPAEAILEMAERLLPLIESPKMLKELNAVFPQKLDEEDPILQRANQLIAESEDPILILQMQFIELDRHLAFNQLEQAAQSSKTILSQAEHFPTLLKERDGLRLYNIINYAEAFNILGDEALAQLWIDAAKQYIDVEDDYQKSNSLQSISRYYNENNQTDLAFQYAVDALKAQKMIDEKNTYRSQPSDLSRYLSQLVELYFDAGQYEDVLVLLDKAKGWNASDLESINSNTRQSNIQTLAALALHHTGQSTIASKILRDYLRYNDNASDPAYAALIEIEGVSAVPFLKTLQHEAPFEERPLIWQAVLAQQAGNLENAEKLAREAIAIDPTDGEMDEFDRLRAYALLAEILAEQGKDEAQLYADIVKAVDIAETGDRYRVAGLKTQALIHYDEAINLFKDAYCVRFRTAVELEAAGRIAEAEENFEAAYSLMPDQFGRIESHCFGCEGAFTGDRAGTIAERVFTRMLEERPNKPSLHYLMGYLKESQSKDAEALEHFKRAVELDPLYYNAWGHIRSLTHSSASPDPELAMEATIAMLEFAPRRSASLVRNLKISEYGMLWNELNSLYPILPKRESGIYPLKASAEELEQNPQSNYHRNWRAEQWEITTPAQVLFQQNQISQLLLQN